jgi:hypothetical protein
MEILIVGLSIYTIMLLTSSHKIDFSRGLVSAMMLTLFISDYIITNNDSDALLENSQYVIFFLCILLILELYRNFERKK